MLEYASADRRSAQEFPLSRFGLRRLRVAGNDRQEGNYALFPTSRSGRGTNRPPAHTDGRNPMHATQIQPGSPLPQVPHARAVLVLRTPAGQRRRVMWLAAGITIVAAAAIGGGLWAWRERTPLLGPADEGAGAVGRLVMPTKAADLSVILDTDVMPLEADDARALNEERPLDVVEVTPANPFRVVADADAAGPFDAALKCLTQAIYYEAANEPETGQRAVAQVVLNRVKHPAFPNTICGVVYQGSQRVTGCQFTFTCDGSLARVPLPALYRRAERISREAMSGRVAPEVGNSTNYHADYVVPYWASSLDKLAQIGRHIFYGLRGAIGYRNAFRMRYDVALETEPGAMPIALPSMAATVLPDPLVALPGALVPAAGSQLSEDKRSGSLIPGNATSAVEAVEPSTLRADQGPGQLIDPGSRLEGRASEARTPVPTRK